MRLSHSLLGTLLLVSCTPDASQPGGEPGGEERFDRRQAAVQVVAGAVLPMHRLFVDSVTDLEQALAAAESPADGQRAWTVTMSNWQPLELLQFGPSGREGEVAGGQGWRDQIYSWPLTNTCAIERNLVDESVKEVAWFDGKLVNTYGLDALEYLLFVEIEQTTCPSLVGLEDDFDRLGPEGLQQRQLDYARAVVARLRADAAGQLAAWEAFAEFVETAGDTDSPYAKARCPLDQLSGALFYLDDRVKDLKLAVPAGLSPDCAEANCPEDVELAWSQQSFMAIAANITGFQAAFEGGGLYGLLEAQGSEGDALAQGIRTATDEALGALAAPSESLASLVVSNPEVVADIHSKLRTITTLFKTQYVSLLNIELPDEGAADND